MARDFAEFFRSRNASSQSSLLLYYTGHEKCMPGHAFGPAVRAQYLIHFILNGRGEFHTGGKPYTLTRGQAFLIKPNETTYYIADSTDPWEYIWFAFDGKDVTSILQDCGLLGDIPVANFDMDDALMAAFSDTISQLKSKNENEYMLLGNLYHVFGHLCRNYHAADAAYGSIYLQHALNFIHNNYRNDIHIQDIANYAQVERSYLYRLFMDQFHISPKQYLIQYRLSAAIGLLTNSRMNTTEIAYACGFSDASAFCRYFRRQTGFTPKRYRGIDGSKTLSFLPGSDALRPQGQPVNLS